MNIFSIRLNDNPSSLRTNAVKRRGTFYCLAALTFMVCAALSVSTADAARRKSHKKRESKPVVVEELLPLDSLILPAPKSAVAGNGEFVLRDGLSVGVPRGDRDAEQVAQYFIDLLARTHNIHLRLGASGPIQFVRNKELKGEAYRVAVTRNGITVSAAEHAGLLYASTVVWQLATTYEPGNSARIAACTIDDAPRFQWRGVMLDSARHFQSPQFVKQLLDVMTLHRLNVLHWHLTDDQGWRIEIKKYPRLTEVGAWRVPAGAGPQADIDPKTGKPRLYGGFYSQQQIREIVAYAQERNITIVPEIEMPGHATAAIVAYPKFGAAQAPPKVLSAWGVFPTLYNVDDATLAFLKDVLTEVMDLFPGKYIHIGGDEAIKDQWKNSESVQARMKALNISNEDALQSWFTGQIEAFLSAHGRRLIGWDEILNGALAANATVMSRRGVDGAIAAAKAGHDAVLAPSPTLYFDNRQSASPDELAGRGEASSVKDVYGFDPLPAKLSESERAHILGVQGNLWTEYVRTEDHALRMYFPRVAALADMAWSPGQAHDWKKFGDRFQVMLHRYDVLGIPYNAVPFQVQVHVPHDLRSPTVSVTLSTSTDLGEIHYTIDNTTPGETSPRYTTPFTVKRGQTVRAAVFANERTLTAPIRRAIDDTALQSRRGNELKLCTNGLVIAQEDDAARDGSNSNANRAVLIADVTNPCWIFESAELTGVKQIEASVGQRPFNFQVGDALKDMKLHPPTTSEGELEARLDSCEGKVIATLPLAPAAKNNGITTLRGPIQRVSGRHDVCFTFTSNGLGPDVPNPLWLIDRIRIAPETPNKPASKPIRKD